MLILSVGLLIILSFFNLRLSRSIAYPPFVFTAVWSISLFLLWLLGDMFYPVSARTLAYYFIGALMFSAGGFAALLPDMGTYARRSRQVTPSDRVIVHRALDVGLLLGAVCLPLYFNYMKQMTTFGKRGGSDWAQMRRGIITVMNAPGGSGFRIEPVLLPIFIVLALIAFYEYDGGKHRRWRTYAFILIATGYTLCSSGRSEVLLLLVGLIAVAWIQLEPPQLRLIGTCVFAFLLLFAANQIILEKTNASPRASLSDNLPAVANGLASYAVGGIVGFDYVLRHPGETPNGWKPTRFLTSALNKIGGNFEEPPRDLKYVSIGRSNVTNVYTIYFAFVDYGIVTAACFMVFLGAGTTLAYRHALRGRPLAVMFFASGLYGVIMSVFAEECFSRFAFFLKTTLIVFLLYYAFPKLLRSLSFHNLTRQGHSWTGPPRKTTVNSAM